jgi:hypothetical protein
VSSAVNAAEPTPSPGPDKMAGTIEGIDAGSAKSGVKLKLVDLRMVFCR